MRKRQADNDLFRYFQGKRPAIESVDTRKPEPKCESRNRYVRVKDQYPIEQNYVKLKPSHLVTKEELRRIVYINE